MKEEKGLILRHIVNFSKLITLTWLLIWFETIIFSQVATLLSLGDSASITVINDNVLQIGLIICGFYFSTKCIENVAKGFETFMLTKATSSQ